MRAFYQYLGFYSNGTVAPHVGIPEIICIKQHYIGFPHSGCSGCPVYFLAIFAGQHQ